MKLLQLLHESGIKCPKDIQNTAEKIEITGISLDSRQVKEGDLFVCIVGEQTNGHLYAADAAWKGAAAVLTQEDIGRRPFPVIPVENTKKILGKIAKAFYEDPAKGMRLMGVTGTNGKTTITYMLQRILAESGCDCGIIGTIGYHVGARQQDRQASRTTPEAFETWELLWEMRENGLTDCAMEVSSHGLVQGRADGLSFAASIFTNLTGDHMDFHKTMEEYYQAKKKLFYMTEGASVVNVDDGYGARLAGELAEDGKDVWRCSLRERDADLFGEVLQVSERGSRIRMTQGRTGQSFEVALKIPGKFNVYNAMEAAACCFSLGIDGSRISEALSSFSGAPGRFEPVENSCGLTVIVDYAHTPDALENVLNTAKAFTRGRLIAVFGCGGDRDRSKRPVMGRIAGSYSDYCIITSDNPRTEAQQDISAEIERGLKETGCLYEVIESRKAAIEKALSEMRREDVVVVAGKGHENYQLIGSSKNYFSDRETVKQALELRYREHGGKG